MIKVFENNNSDIVSMYLNNNNQDQKDKAIKEIDSLKTTLKKEGLTIDERKLASIVEYPFFNREEDVTKKLTTWRDPWGYRVTEH